jgi:Mn2+/Fe2+ NRAMP family transporter
MSAVSTANQRAEDQRREPDVHTTQNPPQTIPGILRRLGPGMIIAASIVGSGELIGTTKTGAQAGFWLLWLIVIGCVIKVFVQVEFGRFAVAEGRTSIEGMNQVPGPRLRVNWLVWYWLVMFLFGLGQLGGIVGVVGESLAITFPLTGDKQRSAQIRHELVQYDRALRQAWRAAGLPPTRDADTASMSQRRAAIERDVAMRQGTPPAPPTNEYTYDDIYWSWIVTVITASLLVNGRYSLIQKVATVLVAGFTAVTAFNVLALQSHEVWAIHLLELRQAFSFRLPPTEGDSTFTPLMTALATFGIIGVGASELVAYPYWCLEHGYARYTGPRNASAGWATRAQGWMRVMRWDAWMSMVVYTFATVAFYLLGAAVLHREGLDLQGSQIVYTLAQMYVPVFGRWAGPIFLLGAFAVLYSTFFVATAGNSRMAADAARVFRVGAHTEKERRRLVRFFCGVFPFISVTIFTFNKNPVHLVLISGLIQSVMLPMLAGAAIFFRYYRCDPRIRPGRWWDVMLWTSSLGMLVTGVVGAVGALK